MIDSPLTTVLEVAFSVLKKKSDWRSYPLYFTFETIRLPVTVTLTELLSFVLLLNVSVDQDVQLSETF